MAPPKVHHNLVKFLSFLFPSNLLHFPQKGPKCCFSFETGPKCRQQIGLKVYEKIGAQSRGDSTEDSLLTDFMDKGSSVVVAPESPKSTLLLDLLKNKQGGARGAREARRGPHCDKYLLQSFQLYSAQIRRCLKVFR